MSVEMLSGGVQEFNEVVQRGDCPFLNSLGAAALEKMRATLETPATQDSEQLSTSGTSPKTEPISEKTTREKPTSIEVVDAEAPIPSMVSTESPRLEIIPNKPTEVEPPIAGLSEAAWAQPDEDIQEVLLEQPEIILQIAESEAVEPRVQPEIPQAERVATAEIVPEPELPILVVPTEANIEATQMEQSEIEYVEPVRSTLELVPTDNAEPQALKPEEIILPPTPVTIVELLAESLSDSSLESEPEESQLESDIEPDAKLDTEPVTLFSMQLERLVAETVEPERQGAVEALIAEVYEIVAQADEESEPDEINVEQVTGAPEITMELEEIVTELLQELGIDDPAPEQIKRFIALVQADQRPMPAVENNPAWLTNTHDLSQSFTSIVSARYHAFLRLHQPLGRTALDQPIAA